jgi:predicted kinase
MSGYPGSGKSTLARTIGNRTGAIVIDHDIVKTALLESMESNLDPKATGKISYHIEWSLIDFLLSQGHSVIFDSPCFYTEMVEKGTNLAQKYKIQYKYVECYVKDMEEINKRLKQRNRMISQIQQVHSEEAFKFQIENSKRPTHFKTLIVDSSQPIENYIPKVMDYMKTVD